MEFEIKWNDLLKRLVSIESYGFHGLMTTVAHLHKLIAARAGYRLNQSTTTMTSTRTRPTNSPSSRSFRRMMRVQRKSFRCGAAVVEFAVILPVFLLILLGTIETCTMVFLQQSLEIAAYEGARVTIVPKTQTSDVQAAANDLLAARRVNGATISVTPSDFQSAPYGSFIRVDVSAPCSSNAVFPLSFYGSKTLTGTVEMMKEFD